MNKIILEKYTTQYKVLYSIYKVKITFSNIPFTKKKKNGNKSVIFCGMTNIRTIESLEYLFNNK